MTRTFGVALALWLCACAAAFGAVWTPDNLPVPYLKDRTQYVSNPDGILPSEATDSINRVLRMLEDKTGTQCLVVVVEHVEDDDPYGFCMALAEKYGIGQKGRDNGLVMLLATGDRSYQILTGRGLEGTLPDAVCKRVENRIMLPRLKEEDWAGAMVEAVKACASYVMGDETQLKEAEDAEEEAETAAILVGLCIFFGIMGLFAVIGYFASHKQCPRCGTRYAFTLRKTVRFRRGGRHYVRTTWVCSKCGHTETREERDTSAEAAAAAALLGTSGGNRRSGFGGGSFGGSFGGGSFGGGGAGGRF